MSKSAKPHNPYPELFKTINDKYLKFVAWNRVPFHAYMWGIDRRLDVDQPRLFLCFFLFAASILVSIKYPWFGGFTLFMFMGGALAYWIHFDRKRAIDALSSSLTMEERKSLAKVFRDMLICDSEMSRLANYKLESGSETLKGLFDDCHQNLTIAVKGFAFNLITDKPDPMTVVEAVQFLMFNETNKPKYWWDIELLGQYTYLGFLTRFGVIERDDLEKVAESKNQKLLSEQLAAL